MLIHRKNWGIAATSLHKGDIKSQGLGEVGTALVIRVRPFPDQGRRTAHDFGAFFLSEGVLYSGNRSREPSGGAQFHGCIPLTLWEIVGNIGLDVHWPRSSSGPINQLY
jgi:hypothetical protein